MYNMNRVFFLSGVGLLLGYYRMHLTGDHYDLFLVRYWYQYNTNKLYNSGELDEILRIKCEKFFPVTEDFE